MLALGIQFCPISLAHPQLEVGKVLLVRCREEELDYPPKCRRSWPGPLVHTAGMGRTRPLGFVKGEQTPLQASDVVWFVPGGREVGGSGPSSA